MSNPVALKFRQMAQTADSPHEKKSYTEAANEISRLQQIINTHDLCHNLHGKVDAQAFADGCRAEQTKLYGYSPDGCRIEELQITLAKMIAAIEPVLMAVASGQMPDSSFRRGEWNEIVKAYDLAKKYIGDASKPSQVEDYRATVETRLAVLEARVNQLAIFGPARIGG